MDSRYFERIRMTRILMCLLALVLSSCSSHFLNGTWISSNSELYKTMQVEIKTNGKVVLSNLPVNIKSSFTNNNGVEVWSERLQVFDSSTKNGYMDRQKNVIFIQNNNRNEIFKICFIDKKNHEIEILFENGSRVVFYRAKSRRNIKE